ncbi:MAG TPA: hypothetical protein VFZ83_03450 [Acidimicrobiia bacterium]|nr:hypothetical protein [Acidimicrobiia bacterium]
MAPLALAVAILAASVGTLAVVGAAIDDDTARPAASGPADDDSSGQPVAAPTDDAHGDGHSHGESEATYDDLPAATQAQVDIAREIARAHPTAADAEAAGWMKATTSLKGIGAHYLRGGVAGFAGTDGGFDVRAPEILLYDGEGPDAPIAGVSYLLDGEDPAGFDGEFDAWHRHNGVCFADGLVIGEIDGHEGSRISMTEEQCTAAGGLSFPIANLTMLHVWVGEGYEGEAPIFAHDHPMLY